MRGKMQGERKEATPSAKTINTEMSDITHQLHLLGLGFFPLSFFWSSSCLDSCFCPFCWDRWPLVSSFFFAFYSLFWALIGLLFCFGLRNQKLFLLWRQKPFCFDL